MLMSGASVAFIPNDFDMYMNLSNIPMSQYGSTPEILFPQLQKFYPAQYIPFITDCDYFGAHIPLWKLLNFSTIETNSTHNKVRGGCTLLDPSLV